MLVGVSLHMAYSSPTSQADLERQRALEFLSEDHGLQKRLVYTGKEQRAEAKENYEEKCERSAFSKMRGKPRWCPELSL